MDEEFIQVRKKKFMCDYKSFQLTAILAESKVKEETLQKSKMFNTFMINQLLKNQIRTILNLYECNFYDTFTRQSEKAPFYYPYKNRESLDGLSLADLQYMYPEKI